MLEDYTDIVSVEEAADILHKSKRAIYRYCDLGAIEHFHLRTASGREMKSVFIPKSALLKYLNGGEE
jgi:hypothetical protein